MKTQERCRTLAWRGWMMAIGSLCLVAAGHAVTPRMPPRPAPPPPTVPLRDRLPALQAGVAQGDPVAMCALASALDDCETYATRLVELQDDLQRRAAATSAHQDAQTADAMERDAVALRARLEPALLGWQAACAGAPALGPAERIDLWHDAAQAGNRTALMVYVGAARLTTDPAGLEPQRATYRAQAEALARSAARRGDAIAHQTLASAYWPGDPQSAQAPLAQAVQPDRAMAVALLTRLAGAMRTLPKERNRWFRARQADFQLQRVRVGMSAQEVTRAERLVAEWNGAWAPIDITPAGLALYWPASEAERLAQRDCAR